MKNVCVMNLRSVISDLRLILGGGYKNAQKTKQTWVFNLSCQNDILK